LLRLLRVAPLSLSLAVQACAGGLVALSRLLLEHDPAAGGSDVSLATIENTSGAATLRVSGTARVVWGRS
jgi:hypothetical protein